MLGGGWADQVWWYKQHYDDEWERDRELQDLFAVTAQPVMRAWSEQMWNGQIWTAVQRSGPDHLGGGGGRGS